MSKASTVIHIVFDLHAGFLQSFEVDDRKRMLKCYWIVDAADGDIRRLGRGALEFYQERLELLLRLASNYVVASMRRIPTDLDTTKATFAAFRAEIATRLTTTQAARFRQAVVLLTDFCDSYNNGRPFHMTMCAVQCRVRYLLPGHDCVVDLGEPVDEWLFDTLRRLRNK